jgi:hypothetical protein
MNKPDAVDWKILDTATRNGCRPEWCNGIVGWAWHCTCDDELHYCDQQCSAITMGTARRIRHACEA